MLRKAMMMTSLRRSQSLQHFVQSKKEVDELGISFPSKTGPRITRRKSGGHLGQEDMETDDLSISFPSRIVPRRKNSSRGNLLCDEKASSQQDRLLFSPSRIY